jgi:hypothetical protein
MSRQFRLFIPTFALALLTCASLLAGAQQVPDKPKPADPAILKAIDNDVWIPFSKAYADMKVEPYIALHSKSLIRILGDLRYVEPYDSFTKNMKVMFENLTKEKAKLSINFRFTERITGVDTASERGIYEFIITNSAGKQNKIYSRFHTFMKKEGGKWKIVMDYDNSEKGLANEASYKAAFARDDYAKY